MHTIRRLELDIRLSRGTPRNEAVEVCRELHEKYIEPALDNALGHYDEDVDIVIPSIRIDLGHILPDDIPYRLEQELIAAIGKAERLLEVDQTSVMDSYENESAVDIPSYMFSEYIKYLETGLLQTEMLGRNCTVGEMFGAFMERGCDIQNRVSDMLAAVDHKPAAFFRLIESMPENCLKAFVAECVRQDFSLSAVVEEHGDDVGLLKFLAMVILLGPGGKKPWAHKLPEFLSGYHAPIRLADVVRETAMEYRRNGDSLRLSEVIDRKVEKLLDRDVVDDDVAETIPSDAIAFGEPAYLERIVVADAGIVLLNPFIHVLFARLGYTDDEDNFVSMESRIRAVNVLKGLVSGFEYPHADYNMVLEKIICGLELSFPVGDDFVATEIERKEIDALFESVTQYWKSMKRASAQALRETFLCRKGTIENDGTGWLLRVEGRSLDILLEDLPWGYSTFVLPWSGQFFVEWQKEY